MSSFAFASLAHIRILLIPVGPIPRDVFDAHATDIRAFDSIRLGDVPGDAKGEKGSFHLTVIPLPSPTFLQLVSFPTLSQVVIFT